MMQAQMSQVLTGSSAGTAKAPAISTSRGPDVSRALDGAAFALPTQTRPSSAVNPSAVEPLGMPDSVQAGLHTSRPASRAVPAHTPPSATALAGGGIAASATLPLFAQPIESDSSSALAAAALTDQIERSPAKQHGESMNQDVRTDFSTSARNSQTGSEANGGVVPTAWTIPAAEAGAGAPAASPSPASAVQDPQRAPSAASTATADGEVDTVAVERTPRPPSSAATLPFHSGALSSTDKLAQGKFRPGASEREGSIAPEYESSAAAATATGCAISATRGSSAATSANGAAGENKYLARLQWPPIQSVLQERTWLHEALQDTLDISARSSDAAGSRATAADTAHIDAPWRARSSSGYCAGLSAHGGPLAEPRDDHSTVMPAHCRGNHGAGGEGQGMSWAGFDNLDGARGSRRLGGLAFGEGCEEVTSTAAGDVAAPSATPFRNLSGNAPCFASATGAWRPVQALAAIPCACDCCFIPAHMVQDITA